MTKTHDIESHTAGQIVPYDTTTGASGDRPWTDPASEPADLPPDITLRAMLRAYEGDLERQRALEAERGLTVATGRRFEIMWDAASGAWVLPVRNEHGELVNLSYRPPHHQKKNRHPWRVAGRLANNGGLPLYPEIPSGNAWVLTAGEFDALSVIQAGLPGVTGLLGCRWHEAWNRHARGKRIAVLFDVGEEDQADTAVENLRCIGAIAWPVRLQGPEGYDAEEFLKVFGPADLLRLIQEASPL